MDVSSHQSKTADQIGSHNGLSNAKAFFIGRNTGGEAFGTISNTLFIQLGFAFVMFCNLSIQGSFCCGMQIFLTTRKFSVDEFLGLAQIHPCFIDNSFNSCYFLELKRSK